MRSRVFGAIFVLILSACTTASVTNGSSLGSLPATTTQGTETPATATTIGDAPTTSVTIEPADLVFAGGPIITMDPARPVAETVAIRGNRIVAVGTDSEIEPHIGEETLLVDLDGRALVPGFVDAHSHYYGALLGEGVDPDEMQDRILSVGVTAVGEAGVNPDQLETLRALDEEGRIRVRTSVYLVHDDSCGEETGDWILDVEPSRAPGDRLHVGGVKVFTDGGSCNAPAVSYEHSFGGMGDLYYDAAQVEAIVRRYGDVGFQVAIHALGDRAVETTLEGLERVIDGTDNPLRHRIEHNAVVRPEMRGRYDQVGAVAVIFGSFGTCAYLGLDDRFRFSTPVENQEWEWPWRDLLDLNPDTVFAWHADYPVFAESTPIASLGGFVTRYQELDDGTECEPEPYHLKHAITVEEALEVMTIGSAYALRRDDEIGSIEAGKLADLVVLSADPRTTQPRELFGLDVELTVLDGVSAYCGAAFESLCAPPGLESEVAASASLPDHPPGHAVDGNLDTHWGAGADAPQWIEIPFDVETEVMGIRLTVDQYPPGPTRHVVWGRMANGELVHLAEVSQETDMFDVLEIAADHPWVVVALRVETVKSPSWVAWREIEIVTVD
jgi:predicted amidohydrolase YtcJ